jgi:hypothetical protein
MPPSPFAATRRVPLPLKGGREVWAALVGSMSAVIKMQPERIWCKTAQRAQLSQRLC